MDWEALEAEFADIDAELADGWVLPEHVVAAAQRRRRTVVLCGAIAAMLVAAGAVAVSLVLLPVRPISAATQQLVRSAGSRPSTATQASIYVAALAGSPRPRPLVRPVWVASTICRSIPTTPQAASCADGVIPPGVRRDLQALLGPRLRFAPSPPLPQNSRDAPVIEFGRLLVRGDQARLGIETFCGPLCGEGQTLVLRLRGGSWRVTGFLGPRWVS